MGASGAEEPGLGSERRDVTTDPAYRRTRTQPQAAATPEPHRGLLFRFTVIGCLLVLVIFMFFLVKTAYEIRVDIHMVCLNTLPEKAAVTEGMCP